jgi:hypothetical protein
MAHTYDTSRYRDAWGSRYVRKVRITIVDTYVTGGWPLNAQDLGFGRTASIVAVIVLNPAVANAILSWEDAVGKLKAIDYAGAEVANASSGMTGVVVHALVIGTGTQT